MQARAFGCGPRSHYRHELVRPKGLSLLSKRSFCPVALGLCPGAGLFCFLFLSKACSTGRRKYRSFLVSYAHVLFAFSFNPRLGVATLAFFEIQDLTYYYPTRDKPSLDQINLQISEGEFLLVTGCSGSGKSTLARLIAGLIPEFYGGRLQGKVLLRGVKLQGRQRSALHTEVGHCFSRSGAAAGDDLGSKRRSPSVLKTWGSPAGDVPARR